MRLHHPGGRLVHLAQGVDVRPAQDADGIVAQLDTSAAAVRAGLDVDVLGLSLWLPPTLAAALAVDSRARHRLRTELDARGLEVHTLSGRPYGGSGEPAAEPDWSTYERLEYTLDLARVLVDLLPDDAVRGSVSTLGLGRRDGWDVPRERACARFLSRLSAGLAEVAWQTGRAVRVGFELEPGCLMDTAGNTVAALAGVDSDRLGVCLDLANLACTWQEPATAIEELTAAGLSVVKVQVAAALEVADPVAAAGTLRAYAGEHDRHQITNPAGGYADDLDSALQDALPGPWRMRHHLPLRSDLPAPLTATTAVWRAALRHLMSGPVPASDQLDLHTGPGDLPTQGEAAPDPAALAEGAAGELAYLRDELAALGLVPPHRTCAAR
ncbi:MAG TPA: TIM barrel protein [Actinoplanes sp.]|jgi:sugar phosphate isomerase/epimerase